MMNRIIFSVSLFVAIHIAYGEHAELTEEQRATAFQALYSNDPALFGGDMNLTSSQKAGLKNRVAHNNMYIRWPKGIVPYHIDKSLNNIAGMIKQAADHIQKATDGCIKLIPRTTEANYVGMYYGQGCNSPVGMTGRGVQWISLGDGCAFVGTIIHEILHAIGFDHEQNRPDRDNYLSIDWNNIQDGLAFAFNKVDRGLTYTDFDYDSIMLYGNNAFAKDYSRPTMWDKKNKPPRKLYHPYERTVMTTWDAYEIKRFYQGVC
jgi:hypothetical protein